MHGLKVLIERKEIFKELPKFIELRRSIVYTIGQRLFICYFMAF